MLPTPIIDLPPPYQTAAAPGAAPHWPPLPSDTLAAGADLTDASATIQPGTDKASYYRMPAATRTENRATTLGVTSVATGHRVCLRDYDLSANTWTITNGGTNGGNPFVFPTSHTKPIDAWFFYNSVNWIFEGFTEVAP